MKKLYALVKVMKRLRGKNGCPWDREQTQESLKPYLLEEAYELFDAIEKRDDRAMQEELGDLLLQVIFHAQIAQEEGRFTIDDVAGTIVEKLKRRHPHVFGRVKVKGSDHVLENWEQIKKDEGKRSVLGGVPRQLPALLKARRVQEKAKRVGFDWESVTGAFDKVIEETKELKKVVAENQNNRTKVEEEFGDLLFSLVNVSRFLGIDAEESLRKTIIKVTRRFQYIEDAIEKRGRKQIKDYSLQELDALWEEAKEAHDC